MSDATEMKVQSALLREIEPGDRLPFLDEVNDFPERAMMRLARAAIKAMHEDSVPIPTGLPREHK